MLNNKVTQENPAKSQALLKSDILSVTV